MEHKQNRIVVAVILLAFVGLYWLLSLATAGNLEPSEPPSPTMHTLEEIYNAVAPPDTLSLPHHSEVEGSGPIHMTATGESQGAIMGSVTAQGREGSTMVIGTGQSVRTARDAASGMPSGQRQHNPFTIIKYLDKATPKLYLAWVNNELLTNVTLRFYRIGHSETPEHYYTVTLQNAQVCDITLEGDNTNGEHKEREHISFCYQKIIWTWVDGGITAEDDWEAPTN